MTAEAPKKATATPPQASSPEFWSETKVVGKPIPRVDAYERLSGSAVYAADVILPEMLHAAILGCPHAHARVKKLDAAQAEKMPGVRAVLTNDSPEGAQLFQYEEGMMPRLFDPLCRFEGEAVAAVAAETPEQAWDAVRTVRVEWEVLPHVSDETKALEANAPKVHDTGNQAGKTGTYSRGDVAAGFAQADVALEETYSTACELHTPMERHGCVAKWDGPKLTVWDSTQGVFETQRSLAQALQMPLANVRVIGPYMGGGFGSKLQISKLHVIAAHLARRTACPVKLFLTREETFLSVGNRPPAHMRVKAGVKKDGTLTALEMSAVATGGAYSGGQGLIDWLVRDLYLCPNVRTEVVGVFIHAGTERPMRAPGHPQGAWALEQMMDALADKLGMDPVELRLKNIATVSQGRGSKERPAPPYVTTYLRECLAEGAAAFGWKEARAKAQGTGPIRRGVGVAAGLWIAGGGSPPANAIVKLLADGSVILNMGAADIGTGTKTVMAQIVAEDLGVPLERITIENADTGTTPYSDPSGGSKTVPSDGPAVHEAALAVKREVLALAAAELKVPVETLRLDGGAVVSISDASLRKPLGELGMLRRRAVIVGVGSRQPNPPGRVVNPFAAHFCEVEVDQRTGEVKILRFLAVQDSGRVMNGLTFENQVQGGVTMGIGLALTEKRILDRAQTGKMVNRNWHDYKLPTMLDVPTDLAVLPIDKPSPEINSTGAKGLGEPATIPAAAAVANAIAHATGVRVKDSPINTIALCRALAGREKEA